ncbi:MAG TPA: type II secretion system F family protein [Verrucomicrobiae bacterium]|nr:type II secretion system F family protein [Verrucomicrobiae bacterium]
MSPIWLFIVLLAITFGVILWILAPSKRETDIQRHLRDIGSLYSVDAAATNILKQQSLSAVPWINRILIRIPGAFKLRLSITQAGSRWSVGTLILSSIVAAFFAAWCAALLVPILAIDVLIGLAAGGVPGVYLFVRRQSRFRQLDAQLPEAIDLMSRALRAGHAVISAIELIAQETSEPLASEFRAVFDEQNLGLPIREALLNLVSRVPTDDVRFLATAILVQKETGGNLAEILDKAGTVMRERIRLKGQLRVYTAQGRLTGWFLCLLPFFVFGLISLANHEYERQLWANPIGVRLIYAALILMALGVYTIRKIINIRV